MARIKRDANGNISVIEKTASYQEQAKAVTNTDQRQEKLLSFFHAQAFEADAMPNVTDIPFKVSAKERDLAWSTYTLELQVAANNTTDSQE